MGPACDRRDVTAGGASMFGFGSIFGERRVKSPVATIPLADLFRLGVRVLTVRALLRIRDKKGRGCYSVENWSNPEASSDGQVVWQVAKTTDKPEHET